MMPAMEIDSYWRTRTIAEARAQRRHGHEGGGGCGQFLQPAVPDLHPHIPETEQPRRGLPTKAVRFLPPASNQRGRGEMLKPIPPALFLQSLAAISRSDGC